MKKIVLIITLLLTSVFGYNYNGNWVNTSETTYNDPVRLKIKNSNITPFVKIGSRIAKLKTKQATDTGKGLFEAWGFQDKNVILFIKPINSYTIKVYVKKIYVNKKKILTKIFIFKNKHRQGKIKAKKRYAGSWINQSPFSAISRLRIKQENGKIIVKAWRPTDLGEQYLGAATARVRNEKLHLNWKKNHISVTANITGLNYFDGRYNKLKLDLTAYNSRNGTNSSQTIYFKRLDDLPARGRPVNRHLKVGPIDINIMTNSY